MTDRQEQGVDSGQSVFDRLTRFVKNIFKTNLEIFFEALKLSPNAQGYVGGSITELLLKQKRYDEHKFLFANPQQLDSSGSDPNHLQQNYIMGFVFADEKSGELSLTEEWYENLFEVFDTLDAKNSVREADMQVDNRNAVVIGIDEAPEIDE